MVDGREAARHCSGTGTTGTGTTVERSGEILYIPRNLAACLLAGRELKNSNSWGGSRDAMHSRVEIDRNWHWYFDCTRDADLRTGRRSKRALAWGWRKAMLRT